MCMNYADLGKQFALLNDFTDAYHWDFMDGHYVPNVSLNFEMLETVSPMMNKPIHAHLMVSRPQDYVDRLIQSGVNEICFHVDTVSRQIFRLIDIIKKASIGVGLVLNPMEPVDTLQYVAPYLDSVTVMTVDPGFAGQRFIDDMLHKISSLNELKAKHGYIYQIEVDGGVNASTFDRLLTAGAERFILGSSGLFSLGEDLVESIQRAQAYIPSRQ